MFAYGTVLLLLVVNIGLVIGLTFAEDLGATVFSARNYADVILFKPWSRIGPYLVGILFGFMFFEYKMNEHHSELETTLGSGMFRAIRSTAIVRHFSALLGFGIICCCIWLPMNELEAFRDTTWPTFIAALYNALARPVFALGFILLFAGSLVSKHSFFRSLLAGEGWEPFSKLTLMVYLIQFAMLSFYYGNGRGSIYLNDIDIIWIFMGIVVMSFVFAIPGSLVFEAPFLALEKMFLLRGYEVDRSHRG